MTPRWSRKRSHFPLVALVFMVFIVSTILFNERSIQQIHNEPDHVPRHQETAIRYIKPNLARQSNGTTSGNLSFQGIFSLKVSSLLYILHRSYRVFSWFCWSEILGFSEFLDRFSRCNSTRQYSGKRIWLSETEPELGMRREDLETCDVFKGKWVFDNVSYPLYNASECQYMSDQLACQKHGRPDLGFQYWRWQPHNCNLKRWSVTEMWEKLRGKRLMFVGDSLNRGQWISMVCLLQSVIPAEKRSMTPNAPLTIFRAEEYNATVEFLWAPLLADSNSDDPVNHRLDERIIRPDSVLKHSAKWQHADILVFNSYLWWRQGPVKLLWTAEENGVCEELDGLGAMELAMGSWADWVASNVDTNMKKIFFVTMSPTHLWSQEWEPRGDGNCYGEKTPIDWENYWGSGSDLPTMRMVDRVLRRLDSKVQVLNVTQLSEYRKDGHPSIYRKFWETFSPEQFSNPKSYSDCIHWCLPGVPDVWNELLFHFL